MGSLERDNGVQQVHLARQSSALSFRANRRQHTNASQSGPVEREKAGTRSSNTLTISPFEPHRSSLKKVVSYRLKWNRTVLDLTDTLTTEEICAELVKLQALEQTAHRQSWIPKFVTS